MKKVHASFLVGAALGVPALFLACSSSDKRPAVADLTIEGGGGFYFPPAGDAQSASDVIIDRSTAGDAANDGDAATANDGDAAGDGPAE
jgi:hypothetical protein